MLIVDVVTRLVIALICGVIATMATREKKTVAMLWIRGGVVLIGLGALTDAIVSIATMAAWCSSASGHSPMPLCR